LVTSFGTKKIKALHFQRCDISTANRFPWREVRSKCIRQTLKFEVATPAFPKKQNQRPPGRNEK
jgi:hypothetical protein